MQYELATRVGSGVVRHTLDGDYMTVEYEKTGRRDVIPLDDVTQLHLLREFAGIYRMKVSRRRGRTLSIPSRHFEAVGQFEDRGPQYAEFVRTLHAECHRVTPRTRFVAGSTFLFWLGWFFVVCGAALGLLLLQDMAAAPWAPPLKLVWILPMMAVVGASLIVQGRRVRYEHHSIPAKFLPGG